MMCSGPYRKWNVQMALTCELSWFVVKNPRVRVRRSSAAN